MTGRLWAWDTSHYDGKITRTTTDRAKAEGISILTAKVGEGMLDTEGTQDDTTLAAGRDSGIPFLGAYFIPRTNATPADQVAYWVRLLDAGEPWWRDHSGWFVQGDVERWPYDNVPISFGIECCQRLRDATDRQLVLYASHGQYGDTVTWDGPRWNADYVSRPAAGFAAMYPGDSWQPNYGSWRGGWAPYGQPKQSPDLLQFTSSATIAGLTTCDASAFRGGLDDFRALIGGAEMQLSDKTHLLKVDPHGNLVQADEVTVERLLQLAQLQASQAAVLLDDTGIARIAAALATHPTPGTGTDPAAIEAALREILPTIRLSAAS
jgi:hypothetical protein